MTDTATTQGVHHVGLTVPDLPGAVRFFIDTLGFAQIGEKPDYPAVFVSDGTTMITLWQAATDAVAFDFGIVALNTGSGALQQSLALHNLEATGLASGPVR